MLADLVEHVIGVDPDRDRFTVGLIDSGTGGAIDSAEFKTCPGGYRDAIEWADGLDTTADSRVWVVEGSGSYGSGLTQVLSYETEWVIEFDHPQTRATPDGAKSDRLDAFRGAREALGRDKWAQPRARGNREGLRALLVARNGAQKSRTKAINELKALILTAPVELREDLKGLTKAPLLKRCSGLRPDPAGDIELHSTKTALRAIARRINTLTAEANELEAAIKALVDDFAPALVDEIGIGYLSAAQIIVSWSHPGRCRNAGAFARLAGAAPIEANSGQEQARHRLCRGGDRQLNRALHTIVIVRTAHDQRTKDYISKRLSEGKTKRETRRCLKNYVARHVYRILEAIPQQTP